MKGQSMIAPRFLIGIIIAGLLLTGMCTVGTRVWNAGQGGQEDSARNLAQAINVAAAQESGYSQDVSLEFEVQSGVVYYAKGVSRIMARYRQGDRLMYFERPDECAMDAACVCSCFLTTKSGQTIACDRATCYETAEVPYANNFKECVSDQQQNCFELADGGAVFYNQFIHQIEVGNVRGRMGVYVQKWNGFISICDELEQCISEDEIVMLRQIQELERSATAIERCDEATSTDKCGCASLEIMQNLPSQLQVRILADNAKGHKLELYDSDAKRILYTRRLLNSNDQQLKLYWTYFDRSPASASYFFNLAYTWPKAQNPSDVMVLDGASTGSRVLVFGRHQGQTVVFRRNTLIPEEGYIAITQGAILQGFKVFIDSCRYS